MVVVLSLVVEVVVLLEDVSFDLESWLVVVFLLSCDLSLVVLLSCFWEAVSELLPVVVVSEFLPVVVVCLLLEVVVAFVSVLVVVCFESVVVVFPVVSVVLSVLVVSDVVVSALLTFNGLSCCGTEPTIPPFS